jgi:hypothetical protein
MRAQVQGCGSGRAPWRRRSSGARFRRGRRCAASAPNRTQSFRSSYLPADVVITLTGDRDHIAAELLRIRSRHGADPSSEAKDLAGKESTERGQALCRCSATCLS